MILDILLWLGIWTWSAFVGWVAMMGGLFVIICFFVWLFVQYQTAKEEEQYEY